MLTEWFAVPILDRMTRIRWIALAVGVALVVSACGSGGSDDGTKQPENSTALSVATDDATTPTGASTTIATSRSAPTTSTAPNQPQRDAGTRDNPVAIGELVAIGDWLVRLVSAVPDAADQLLADDDFLDPPAAGNVFFLVKLEGTYVGEASAAMWGEFLFNAVGSSNVEYDEFGASCGFIDGGLSNQGEAFPGGSVSGYQCFEVSAEDADTLTIYLEPVFSAGPDDRVFLAPRDGVGSPTGIALPGDLGPGGGTGAGSRANPAAIGSYAQIGDWFVRLQGVDLDATDRVLSAGTFNEEPKSGYTYVLADIDVTYVGSEPESFWFGLDWTGVGPDNVAIDVFEATCGLLANEMGTGTEFFTNGSASGEICLAVPTDGLDELVLFFDSFDGDRQFFAINDGQGEATDVTVPVIEVAAGGREGSRGNEIDLGSAARVGEWDVTVVGFDEDATELVLAENQFNDPPADGSVFVLIDLRATYRGADSSSFWADLSWLILRPTNVAFISFDVSCGTFPNDFAFADEVFQGGTSEGSVCFEVPASEVGELSLIIDDFSTFGDEGRVVFDLG